MAKLGLKVGLVVLQNGDATVYLKTMMEQGLMGEKVETFFIHTDTLSASSLESVRSIHVYPLQFVKQFSAHLQFQQHLGRRQLHRQTPGLLASHGKVTLEFTPKAPSRALRVMTSTFKTISMALSTVLTRLQQ